MYQLESVRENTLGCVRRLSDGAIIPFDGQNVDYQEYLKWLSAGNIPQAQPIT